MLLVTDPLGAQSLLLIEMWSASWLPYPGYDATSAAYSWEADEFFARTDRGLLDLLPDGTGSLLAMPEGSEGVPAAGGDIGQILAWSGDGIWVGPDENAEDPWRQIFASAASLPQWGPGAQNLLFFTADGLYTAAAPDYIPARVGNATAVDGGGVSWVWSWR
jgi:hypothetical protein